MRSHKEAALDSYKCHECTETFSDRDKLFFHSAQHAAESLKCPLCKEQFDHLDDVTEHIKQHTEGEQYACEFCDSIFLTEDQLHEHSDTQHTEENLLYDDDDRKRQKQNVEVLESFTIVGDVLVPNNAANEIQVMEYNSDATDEYTIIAKGGESTDDDDQPTKRGVKVEPNEPPTSLPKKPLRSYGNASKSALNKVTAGQKEAPAQKTEKVVAKPANTKVYPISCLSPHNFSHSFLFVFAFVRRWSRPSKPNH